MALEALHDQTTRRALDASARWLGIGVAAAPAIDIADRAGMFVLLTSPETLEWGMVAWPLVQLAAFVGLGIGASALQRRHRPRARTWFFASCALPVLVFTLATGLRLSATIALIALCFSFVQLRLSAHAPPLA